MNAIIVFVLAIVFVAWLISPYYVVKYWYNLKQTSKKSQAIIEEYDQKLRKSSKDLENLHQSIQKFEVKTKVQIEMIESLTNEFVKDSLKFICTKINSNNYETSKKKADKVFEMISKLNIPFPFEEKKKFYYKIKTVFATEVKKDEARRVQSEIKSRIREEQVAEREYAKEIRRLNNQSRAIEQALKKAREQLEGEHDEEINLLKKQLEEVRSKEERAKSQAQLTRSGHIYVISNLGSFGKSIYKVGMTRRLEPMDRVKELGDSSVPFPFDVHMMVSCEDAPTLESQLHRDLSDKRVNKVNLRKEFFRVELDEIQYFIEKNHGKVEYRATADAFEYNETLAIEDKFKSTEEESNNINKIAS